VAGTVVDPEGRPIRVEVQLQSVNRQVVRSTYTDSATGQFSFDDLRFAAYHVVVQEEPFRPVDIEIVLRAIFLQTVRLNLQLQYQIQQASGSPASPTGSESGTVEVKHIGAHLPRKSLKAFEKGNRARARGDLDQAIRHYREALTASPDFGPALTNLGGLYLRQNKLAEAETVFGEAHRLDPDSAETCINLGHTYMLAGRLEEAAELLRRGARLAPNSSLAHFLLGSTLAKQGAFSASEASLKRAIDLTAPKVGLEHLELANLYLKTQRWQEAGETLEAFLRAHPDDPQADSIRQTLRRIEVQRGPVP